MGIRKKSLLILKINLGLFLLFYGIQAYAVTDPCLPSNTNSLSLSLASNASGLDGNVIYDVVTSAASGLGICAVKDPANGSGFLGFWLNNGSFTYKDSAGGYCWRVTNSNSDAIFLGNPNTSIGDQRTENDFVDFLNKNLTGASTKNPNITVSNLGKIDPTKNNCNTQCSAFGITPGSGTPSYYYPPGTTGKPNVFPTPSSNTLCNTSSGSLTWNFSQSGSSFPAIQGSGPPIWSWYCQDPTPGAPPLPAPNCIAYEAIDAKALSLASNTYYSQGQIQQIGTNNPSSLCAVGKLDPTSFATSATGLVTWTCLAPNGPGSGANDQGSVQLIVLDSYCAPYGTYCVYYNHVSSLQDTLALTYGIVTNPTPAAPNPTSTWSCQGDFGGLSPNNCTASIGKCGTASGTNLTTSPSSSAACSSGSPVDINGNPFAGGTIPLTNGKYNWSCSGSNGGAPQTCSATSNCSSGAFYNGRCIVLGEGGNNCTAACNSIGKTCDQSATSNLSNDCQQGVIPQISNTLYPGQGVNSGMGTQDPGQCSVDINADMGCFVYHGSNCNGSGRPYFWQDPSFSCDSQAYSLQNNPSLITELCICQ